MIKNLPAIFTPNKLSNQWAQRPKSTLEADNMNSKKVMEPSPTKAMGPAKQFRANRRFGKQNLILVGVLKGGMLVPNTPEIEVKLYRHS